MIKVRLLPQENIKVRLTPPQGIKVGLKTTYLYDNTLIDDQVKLAKDWAIKMDGKVVEEGEEIDYSAKYYAGEAKTSETNASDSANAASGSATSASASASSASGSASTATTQAGIATTKAGEAALSATAASNSATLAGNSATSASNSATTATTQAGISTTQAGIATTKASEAGGYASDALASKNAAATSESNAQTWAEGNDAQVALLGGEKSSKGWAARAKEIVDSIGSVLHYKGSVATYDDLPISGQVLGDMYNITSDGSNYVWTGTGWDAISGIVDLSAYRTASDQDLIDAGFQAEITASNKLDADLVDDSTSTNKFVTASDKTTWNGKQDAISDLETIRSGASAGATALQPNASITGATKCKITYDSKGLVTAGADLSSSDITTALGYTPYNSTNPSGYQANVLEGVQVNGTDLTITGKKVNVPVPTTVAELSDAGNYVLSSSLATVATSGQYSDLTGTPTIPTVNNSTITITQGGVTKGSFTLNQASGDTIALDAGGGAIAWGSITGTLGDQTDLQSALNNKYDASNPNGYTSNVGTVTSVNNTSPDGNGNVSLTIPDISNLADKDLSNLSATGQGVIDGKANTSLNNLTSTGKNIGNWSTNITNCITEIPQDIKLELNNGTLTLKAGSKVYVPNGSGVFDVITIASDITKTTSSNYTWLLVYDSNQGTLRNRRLDQSYSGGTAPTSSTEEYWYDTTNNKCGVSSNTGSTWTYGMSLPIAVVTSSGGALTSIDQVFNGFGYIGSVGFALPGVKGLIPNGFNEDGTLKNNTFTMETVGVSGGGSSWTHVVISNALTSSKSYTESETVPSENYTLWYKPSENKMYRVNSSGVNSVQNEIPIYEFDRDSNGRVINFSTKPILKIPTNVDGQWIYSNQTLASSVSAPTSGTVEYDLSTYLPNDSYNYEVLVTGFCICGSSAGNLTRISLFSDIITSNTFLCGNKTSSGTNIARGYGTLIMPIGTGRKLKQASYNDNTGTHSIYLMGYRRIGTNI